LLALADAVTATRSNAPKREGITWGNELEFAYLFLHSMFIAFGKQAKKDEFRYSNAAKHGATEAALAAIFAYQCMSPVNSRDLILWFRRLVPGAATLLLWLLMAGDVTPAGLATGLLVALAVAGWTGFSGET
jgi:hypothetical protein